MPAPPDDQTITFGHTVTFKREDGREQTFRIVGEDEAEPKNGTISYVSPIARAVIGKKLGEMAVVNGGEITIVAIASGSSAGPGHD